MTSIFARQARLADRWAYDLHVTLDDGRIAELEPNTSARPNDVRVDTLLPAPSNLHSHAFQRAMAGMTEFRSAGHDSFWTWRELMYRFAAALGPEDIEAIAALVFMEMQEAGYAAVGEFHYIHHRPGGGAYSDVAELSNRVLAAASETGIGLTHLPVLYTYGGADKAELSEGQLRFRNEPDAFLGLVDAIRGSARNLPADTAVGIAPHSLRATAPDDLRLVLAEERECPVHIHISEQPKEVDDIAAWLGARPVEWLLANAPVDSRWCLVHATHMTDAETVSLARSGAVAGLCPITEANLGDGPFNGRAYLEAGGAFGIGSDSNVRISLTEELRLLEYSQRLRDLERNVLVTGGRSVGETVYLGAARGGAQAIGRDAGDLSVGRFADLVAIDGSAPALSALTSSQLLDGFCFAADDRVVTDLWSAGRHMVRDGRHVARDRIIERYRATLASLLETM